MSRAGRDADPASPTACDDSCSLFPYTFDVVIASQCSAPAIADHGLNMKQLLALPAVLRTSLFLASASQNTFSVHDDLLAFPQYEVKFVDDYILEGDVESRLRPGEHVSPASGIEQYNPTDSYGSAEVQPDDTKYEHEAMVLDGQRYLCSIPVVAKPEDNSTANDTLSKAEEEKELARATDRGWELLSGMEGNCMYFVSGWWSYRFCYGQGVKQFHQLPPSRGVPVYPPVEDPGVEGYELGNYEAAKAKEAESDDEWPKETGNAGDEWEGESGLDVNDRAKHRHRKSGYGELVQRGENRYLVQRLGGGTRCDLTGKERRIDVEVRRSIALSERQQC
jgi:protein OS-9